MPSACRGSPAIRILPPPAMRWQREAGRFGARPRAPYRRGACAVERSKSSPVRLPRNRRPHPTGQDGPASRHRWHEPPGRAPGTTEIRSSGREDPGDRPPRAACAPAQTPKMRRPASTGQGPAGAPMRDVTTTALAAPEPQGFRPSSTPARFRQKVRARHPPAPSHREISIGSDCADVRVSFRKEPWRVSGELSTSSLGRAKAYPRPPGPAARPLGRGSRPPR
jgi:hypothetical protein